MEALRAKAERAAGLVVRRDELATGDFSSRREGCLAAAEVESERRPERLALTRAKEAKAERAAAILNRVRNDDNDDGLG